MIRILAYGVPAELNIVRELLTAISIQYDIAEYELECFKSLQEWSGKMRKVHEADVVICDVTDQRAVEQLIEARKQYKDAKIMPIADEKIIPSVYVRPDIFPCALLWRPMDTENNKKALLQVLLSFEKQEEKNTLYIETRQKTQAIPYDRIYYIEARDKKLFVRTEYQEIGFSGTLSRMEKELEQFFVRCHKGYLVNKRKIQSIDWSNHLVQIGDSVFLPISRSCLGKLREVYQNANFR